MTSQTAPTGSPDRFAGKTVVITGAGSLGSGWGNGKATAVLYARQGARVVAVDRRVEAAEETVAIIHAEGGTAVAVAADVTDETQVDAMIQEAVALYGTVDVLQNNVGVGILGPTHEVTQKQWDTIFKINVRGSFLCTKAVLPIMLAQGRGAIVNISSVASRRWTGIPYASYAASKAALNQFSQSVALEYARQGIRSNVLLVGYMDTPTVYAGQSDFHDSSAQDLASRRNAVCPMGHMGDAWDVAMASTFLASDEARYITGVELPVDGGLGASSIAAAGI